MYFFNFKAPEGDSGQSYLHTRERVRGEQYFCLFSALLWYILVRSALQLLPQNGGIFVSLSFLLITSS